MAKHIRYLRKYPLLPASFLLQRSTSPLLASDVGHESPAATPAKRALLNRSTAMKTPARRRGRRTRAGPDTRLSRRILPELLGIPANQLF